MSYIEFKNVTKRFGSNTVFENLSLSIEEGEFATLLGPSGCGKSTLLRCLVGFEEIQSGQILINGKDVTHLSPDKRNVGMVFQHYSLFPNMTVEQNIAFGLKMKKEPKAVIAEKVAAIISVVDLNGREKYLPSALSGGQKQRVALARALVTNPAVLLLDEPLSAIDAMLRKSLQIEIRKIQQELNITSVFVTHDQDEAMVMSDVIHVMNKGRVEQSDQPSMIYTQPKTRFVANFIGNYNVIDTEVFKNLTHYAPTEGSAVAIRPEVVDIGEMPFLPREDVITFNGKITQVMMRGNILRYTVECGRTDMFVDVLYRTNKIFSHGERVHLQLEKKNCLFVA
ncbi:MAG: ABC transporter ATP-binding protein [Neisseria sp.]|nr:ABC transporter ATP-binding protein [Neisseria sp.]